MKTLYRALTSSSLTLLPSISDLPTVNKITQALFDISEFTAELEDIMRARFVSGAQVSDGRIWMLIMDIKAPLESIDVHNHAEAHVRPNVLQLPFWIPRLFSAEEAERGDVESGDSEGDDEE